RLERAVTQSVRRTHWELKALHVVEACKPVLGPLVKPVITQCRKAITESAAQAQEKLVELAQAMDEANGFEGTADIRIDDPEASARLALYNWKEARPRPASSVSLAVLHSQADSLDLALRDDDSLSLLSVLSGTPSRDGAAPAAAGARFGASLAPYRGSSPSAASPRPSLARSRPNSPAVASDVGRRPTPTLGAGAGAPPPS
ncbi:MAG TPA: hypothetical protein VFH51_00685, partial [Myxococcota bacterium]|nr:hypothetical protein [Myxococcota bacterium]